MLNHLDMRLISNDTKDVIVRAVCLSSICRFFVFHFIYCFRTGLIRKVRSHYRIDNGNKCSKIYWQSSVALLITLKNQRYCVFAPLSCVSCCDFVWMHRLLYMKWHSRDMRLHCPHGKVMFHHSEWIRLKIHHSPEKSWNRTHHAFSFASSSYALGFCNNICLVALFCSFLGHSQLLFSISIVQVHQRNGSICSKRWMFSHCFNVTARLLLMILMTAAIAPLRFRCLWHFLLENGFFEIAFNCRIFSFLFCSPAQHNFAVEIDGFFTSSYRNIFIINAFKRNKNGHLTSKNQCFKVHWCERSIGISI